MFPTKRILALSALVALASLTSCNSDLDDPDGPNVVLEAENIVIPPVNGTTDETSGLCTFLVTNATATLRNRPKNEAGATSPFNDVVLTNVHVSYDWGPGNAPQADATFGLGGTVPANGVTTAQFAVVGGNDLILHEGQVASLILTFIGRTVSGETVSTATGSTLAVGTCQ